MYCTRTAEKSAENLVHKVQEPEKFVHLSAVTNKEDRLRIDQNERFHNSSSIVIVCPGDLRLWAPTSCANRTPTPTHNQPSCGTEEPTANKRESWEDDGLINDCQFTSG